MKEACFSDINYTTRAACTYQCIPSQDINRRIPGEYPVLSPAEGEVMIVDEGPGVGDNAGRGNFVAIRIPVDNIPPAVVGQASVIGEQGFVYIGYAHLSRIDVTVGTLVSSGQQIGLSGRTGLPTTHRPHLDLAMFFIPADLKPFNYGSGEQYNHNRFNGIAYQEDYYPAEVRNNLPLDIKPSDVWPELTTCPQE
jgi:hypothetical protein